MKVAIVRDLTGKQIAIYAYKRHRIDSKGVVLLDDRANGSNILYPVAFLPFGEVIIEFGERLEQPLKVRIIGGYFIVNVLPSIFEEIKEKLREGREVFFNGLIRGLIVVRHSCEHKRYFLLKKGNQKHYYKEATAEEVAEYEILKEIK